VFKLLKKRHYIATHQLQKKNISPKKNYTRPYPMSQ